MTLVRIASLLLMLPLLTACTGTGLKLYDGPERPPSALAIVEVPTALEVLRINDVETPQANGMFRHGADALDLEPGHYDMLVFYRQVWQTGDDHDVLRSDPAMFSFDAAAGHRYRLAYTEPATRDDAQRLTDSFAGWIVDLDSGAQQASIPSGLRFDDGLADLPSTAGALVAVRPGERADRAPVVAPRAPAAPMATAPSPGTAPTAAPKAAPTTAPGAAGTQIEAAATAQSAPTAVAEAPAAPVAATASASPLAPESDETPWLDTMKSWWQQATPAERRAFLRWTATSDAGSAN